MRGGEFPPPDPQTRGLILSAPTIARAVPGRAVLFFLISQIAVNKWNMVKKIFVKYYVVLRGFL